MRVCICVCIGVVCILYALVLYLLHTHVRTRTLSKIHLYHTHTHTHTYTQSEQANVGAHVVHEVAGPQRNRAALDVEMSAREVVEKSLQIAADICIYTNTKLTIESLDFEN